MRYKNIEFGKDVKERRGNWGLRKCAKVTGVSYATISRVENGKTPDLISFMKICNGLCLDANKYFY